MISLLGVIVVKIYLEMSGVPTWQQIIMSATQYSAGKLHLFSNS